MNRPRSFRLGNMQLRIMKVLWERGVANVAEVHEALRGEVHVAYTTVATMLRKMETRGLVQHEVDGRRFIYRASVAPELVSRSMANDVLERLFDGSLADMVSHLLAHREVSRDELLRLQRLIAERKKMP